MALSLDDKLLFGGKAHNYCSSSEDEGTDTESTEEAVEKIEQPKFIPVSRVDELNGRCVNTGPKGVLNDWREFKRLEREKREEQENERKQLLNKLHMTCRSHLNDNEEKQKDTDFLQELEQLEEDFLEKYRQKRIEEMRQAFEATTKFGKVIQLDRTNFVDHIDREKTGVKIIVHIFEEIVEACESMNGCLSCLAKEYPNIKFCRINATEAQLSKTFSINGVPALLIYKNGELIGNFIRLSDEFGDDFYATEVESFLQEHGMLPMSDVKVIRDKTTGEVRGVLPQDDNEDFDID